MPRKFAKPKVKRPSAALSKWRKFAREYVIDYNRSRAAVAAGFAPGRASSTGKELLAKPEVQKMIRELEERAATKIEVTKENIVGELRNLAFSNIMDFGRVDSDGQFIVDLTKAKREHFAAVTELICTPLPTPKGRPQRYQTKIKLVDKRGPLVDLGKHLGLFRDDPIAGLTVSYTIVGLGGQTQELKIARRTEPAETAPAEYVDPARAARGVRDLPAHGAGSK